MQKKQIITYLLSIINCHKLDHENINKDQNMHAQIENPKENKSQLVANTAVQRKNDSNQRFGFVDNRGVPIFSDNRSASYQLKPEHTNDNYGFVPLHADVLQRMPKDFDLKGKLEKEELLQFKKINAPIQRVSIDLDDWDEMDVYTHNPRNHAKILRYLKYLYRKGKHNDIAQIYNAIDASRDDNRQAWLNEINDLMKYAGLNQSVTAVAETSAKSNHPSNFAQATMIFYYNDGSKQTVKTEVYESGESTPKKGTNESAEAQISKRDSEVGIVSKFEQHLNKKIFENSTKIEIHLVSLYGSCDGCKSRLISFSNKVKRFSRRKVKSRDQYISEQSTPVFMRVYYLTKPHPTTRHKQPTTYGWQGDGLSDQGLFTHDIN